MESSLAEVDAAIEDLSAARASWKATDTPARVALLRACVKTIAAAGPRWVEIGARIKGLPADQAGEEWVAGVVPTIRNARLLADVLEKKTAPKHVTTRPDGRVVARVIPANMFESLMFSGITADVWMEPGKEATRGTLPTEAKVCLVLGGGNVSSIPPMDALYKLFVENEVVLLKMNPVNEDIGPVLADALKPLVDANVLRIVYGGAAVGAHAANHPKIDTLHVTGSDRTYDAIVWGADPEERKRNKASKQKKNEKPFSAELGCVTPVIVVPGPWSAGDIRFQARHVASMVTQNASFNCNAAKVLVMQRDWLQRKPFLEALHEELRKTPARKAYYPGARDRYDAFLREYPGAEVVGPNADDAVPWTIISEPTTDYALENEAFCGVLAEVSLDVEADVFIAKAVDFANDRCWGTLSCCLLVHPETADLYEKQLAKAIADLRYGGIGVNAWPAALYGLVTPTWGAFPGHPAEDIRSGAGVVHNTMLFDHPEKTVLKAPFRIKPTPPWFSDHKNLAALGQRLVEFEQGPSFGGFVRVALAALKG